MQELEQRLQQRYPDWFHGRRGQLARPLLRSVGRWSRLDRIEEFLRRNANVRGFDFVAAGLEFIEGRYHVDPAALARIPATGRLLIVANHPSGALDALALLDAVGRIRRDVRIVANDLLGAIGPLQDLLLPVRILGGKVQRTSLQAVEQALAAEQCVIVFPAGEVSRLSLLGIRDGRWQRGFVRFARAAAAPVLPVRVEARNSALFYGASTLFKPAGTALLAREMFARRGRPLRLRIGEPMQLGQGDPGAQLLAVRRAVYALGRTTPVAEGCPAGPEPLAAPVPPAQVAAGIAAATVLGQTADGKQILLASCTADSPLLHELGRLRELTFRQVGEGTGRSRDLDDFDLHYQHIVIWDGTAQRIAGAYRIMRGAQALARRGLAGLYSASLFRYSDDAIPRIAEGLELGRSFVVPDYWGSRSLDYLWQGIGAYLQCQPGIRYLFGAVSISAALPRDAREQLVAYYQRYYGAADGRVQSNRPFQYFAAPPCFGELDAAAAFDVLKANLAALGTGVPTLYRQYTDLCEPGGARFLAFGVDPDFSDSIDGLIEVDLHAIRPHKRKRYLREAGMPA
ncbi:MULTISPECIES: lysophospholipid acyltransferase family protein [Stenotrophomonas]|uniref:L-ornithine N(alpha)-acyltransferase n=1 Tax=Stenotrophomonas lactitubi TaxID=2045214 RepID=A0AAW4GL33_9GAMM|nr:MULTISPECIES: lysophospholipid acyltransferase family protein [Stenotrophomonas]MBM9914805.1 lysophospholipid acyltransferase family protein [Stenotrophomonas lactitubi]MBM9923765.1 lysophospholipid acyltransferase family protein [Stenotrophomonas lactitubi]MBM9939441.1 lysophospholipid acyltransferase family protein [Stenotrophomonas lactitubi]